MVFSNYHLGLAMVEMKVTAYFILLRLKSYLTYKSINHPMCHLTESFNVCFVYAVFRASCGSEDLFTTVHFMDHSQISIPWWPNLKQHFSDHHKAAVKLPTVPSEQSVIWAYHRKCKIVVRTVLLRRIQRTEVMNPALFLGPWKLLKNTWPWHWQWYLLNFYPYLKK